MMSFFNYKMGSKKGYIERGVFFLLWDFIKLPQVAPLYTTYVYINKNLLT